jgi:hypothetical protein
MAVATGVAIAALAVGIAVAISQFIQTQRQAVRIREQVDLQRRVTLIEEARHRDERQPRLGLRFVQETPDDAGWLEWINEGPIDLDDLSFRLIERSGAGWQPVRGVRFITEGQTLTEGSFGPVKIGEPVLKGLVRTPGSESEGGMARFRMNMQKRS